MQHWMSLWSTHSILCRPHPWKRLHHFDHSSYYGISFQENNSTHHFCCQTDRMLTWELLAALIAKGKDTHSSEWELFLWASQGCPPAKGYVKHSANLKANLCMQHSTDLGPFRLTVTWITNSWAYSGLVVRTTTSCPAPAEGGRGWMLLWVEGMWKKTKQTTWWAAVCLWMLTIAFCSLWMSARCIRGNHMGKTLCAAW